MGNWKCPHCGGLNQISQRLWLLQEGYRQDASMVVMVSSKEVPCPICGEAVDIEDLAKGKYNEASKGCFIATAALGSDSAAEVVILRQFRDKHLSRTPLGQLLLAAYYRISPPLAAMISRYASLRLVFRNMLIRPIAAAISTFMSR